MDPKILELIKANKLSNRIQDLQRAANANFIVINSIKTGENNETIIPNTQKKHKNDFIRNPKCLNLELVKNNNIPTDFYRDLKTKSKNEDNESLEKLSILGEKHLNNDFNETGIHESKFYIKEKNEENFYLKKNNNEASKTFQNVTENNLNVTENNLTDPQVKYEDFISKQTTDFINKKLTPLSRNLSNKGIKQNSNNTFFCDNNDVKLLESHNQHASKNNSYSSFNNQISCLNDLNYKTGSISYSSKYFMCMTFCLLAFTLLPIQYQNENFSLQIKAMQDICSQSFNFSDKKVSILLSDFFQFKIRSDIKIENLTNELNLIRDLYYKKKLKNYSIKYLSKKECISNNFTKLINLINFNTSTFSLKNDSFSFGLNENGNDESSQLFEYDDDFDIIDNNLVLSHENKKRQSVLNTKNDRYENFTRQDLTSFNNSIFICDDSFDKRSIKNDEEKFDSTSGLDLIDFQANILLQWNISCKDLSKSTIPITYSQITSLSGNIIGAIFFSILADFFGRKRIYLLTLYTATIIGSLISIVQAYKTFIIMKFPIAALSQGCFIVSYVLLFEMLVKSKSRHVYCSLFYSNIFLANLFAGYLSKLINDWRYLQLTGSLMSSIAIGYPWIIKESFKWLIIRDSYVKAERVCKSIFKESQVFATFLQLKSHDQINDNFDTWPVIIWKPTFRKIICCFVLMWSILSLSNFFMVEDNLELTKGLVNSYILQNGLLFLCNIGLSCLFFKFGKRIPLGSCMFLGGSFLLASSLINQDTHLYWFKTIFHYLAKILVNCSLNILMLYVCELFPCEIRCSSFSFFLSIKHLSEMFAIYIFKINMISMAMIKIVLSIFCIILCICALVLPENTQFSFNLDYLEYLNKSFLSDWKLSIEKTKKNKTNDCAANIELNSGMAPLSPKREESSILPFNNQSTKDFKINCNQNNSINQIEDNQSLILANTLIKKINCENHCKTGKLNPLYEEDINNLTTGTSNLQQSTNSNYNKVKFSHLIANHKLSDYSEYQGNSETSTKF